MRIFTYHFVTSEQTYSHTHIVGNPLPVNEQKLPEWTRLEFEQCKGCQWNKTDRCPVAIGLEKPAGLLGKLKSFEPIEVIVETQERTYSKKTTVQEGLSSLFGLIMATSGCPSFDFLKGLAWYHLPFSSFEETLFRSVSAYFIMNHLQGRSRSQQQAEEDMKELYRVIKLTNTGITHRLRAGAAPQSDSPMNAVVILDSFGALVPMSVDEGLSSLREIFL